ncbi:MAG: hypothetical protein JWM09_1103, partial [Francisellaceae bacterium]|nr:hypothetical protein [Francisellaceae bacterium]
LFSIYMKMVFSIDLTPPIGASSRPRWLRGLLGSASPSFLAAIGDALIDGKIFLENEVNLLKGDTIISIVVNLLLNARYLFEYPTSHRFYLKKFNENLIELQKKLLDENYRLLLAGFKRISNISEYKFLGLIEKAQALNDIFEERNIMFLIGESVGHKDLAYKLAKKEIQGICQIHGKNFVVTPIEVKRNDNERDDALNGFILIPESHDEINKVINVHITWTGTFDQSTILADLERAPGLESYLDGEDQVLKSIVNSLNKIIELHPDKKINLIVSGHSLGASLAQLCFHSLQKAIVHNLSRNNPDIKTKYEDSMTNFQQELKNSSWGINLSEKTKEIQAVDNLNDINPDFIEGLVLLGKNSPGVLHAITNHTNILSRILTENKISQRAFYMMQHGDLVQATGESNILNAVGENGAEINLLFLKNNQAGWLKKSLAVAGSGPTGYVLASAIATGLAVPLIGGATLMGL